MGPNAYAKTAGSAVSSETLGASDTPQLLNRETRRAIAKYRRRQPGGVGSPGVLAPVGGPPRRAGRPSSPGDRQHPRGNGRPRRDGRGLDVAPPTFTPISSELVFGPPADIAMGWDGTLWAVDASGAAHLYDPIAGGWQPHGDGVDAVAVVEELIYHFRGDSYVTVAFGSNQTQGPPTAIGETWPTLPASFKLGVEGAANVNGQLYLFRGGRYLKLEPGSAGLAPQVFKLTDLTGWPQTPAWQQGAIDAVCSQGDTGQGADTVWLLCGGEYLTVDLANRQVTSQPAPISSFAPWKGHLPNGWADGGIDAGFGYRDPHNNSDRWTLYRGPALVNFGAGDTGVASPQYVAAVNRQWPDEWNPLLAHAPSGRVGALYAATTGGGVLGHDGDQWTPLAALPGNGQARSVAAGRDGTVYAATGTTLHQLRGQGWSPGVTPGVGLGQVAVGDATRVWVRDTGNQVHRLSADGSSLEPSSLVGAATDLAANADGTLWHCNATAAEASAYRFISEGTQASEPIPLPAELTGGPASVHKVASTGFGDAYCLVQPAAAGAQAAAPAQLYAYASNYLFKTSESYNPPTYGTITQGLGCLYFVTSQPGGNGQWSYWVVALDAQTGREVARSQQWDLPLTSPVFDPVNELIYVARTANNDQPDGQYGIFIALDARTLQTEYTFGPSSLETNFPAPPTLQGTQLCFGDNHGVVYMFDTVAAMQQTHSGIWPTPSWQHQGPQDTYALVQPPVLSDGTVSVCTWTAPSAAGEATIHVQQLGAADGTVLFDSEFVAPDWNASHFVPVAPVLGTLNFNNAPSPALVINGYDTIFAFYLGGGVLTYEFPAAPGAWFSSGVTYEPGTWTTVNGTPTYRYGRYWVGDSAGRLYALDGNLQPTANTPLQPRPADAVQTTPVVYTDSAGDPYALFGTAGPSSQQLWVFDPTKPAGQGNPAAVDTGQTAISQLSVAVTNGVVYATGTTDWTTGNKATGQVFAINVDQATQALRDLIVESQLMQDFDEPTDPKADPPTNARYQTHLTVVDDLKTPRPYEPVKLWADQSTSVSINDAGPVQVGPGDDQYVAAQTGADGSLTIATGSLHGDGSDNADMFATPLRVWAGFMDPYERVVIYPDREFHARVTTAQATNSTDDNPDAINLHAAQNYAGTSLFTDQEKSQNQPQNVAGAIQTMTNAVRVAGGGPPPSRPGRSGQRRAAAATGKYLAYDNLPGAGYFATNTPATRPAMVRQPAGLSYADDDSGQASFSTLAHADATAAIDALDGQDWTQSELARPLVGKKSIFRSFWDFLKKAAAKITHIVISIGKEIYAGLRFIFNGVAYFFKHPLQALEDVVAAIGAFFAKLAKLIKNVVEALSVLFHFEEIKATHRLLRDELLNRINGVPGNPTDYPGYVNLIKNNVIPNVKQFFQQGEHAITTALDGFANNIDPKQQVSGLDGAGSTPTTVFTVGPHDNNSAPPSSHSVACTWAMRKVQNGQQDATGTPPSGATAAPSLPQALGDFINTFAQRLGDDGDLHAALASAKAKLNSLLSAKSLKEFIERGLAALIAVVALLVDGVLAVADAFIEGLLTIFADLLTFLFDPNTGLLTRPIHIPVLTALYRAWFQADLTLLDLVMLVAAIPVTIVYRVVSGHYPSGDLQPSGQLRGVNRVALRNAFGILGGIVTIIAGIFNGIADEYTAMQESGFYEFKGSLSKFVGIVAMCAAVILQGATEPQVTAMAPGPYDWAIWGVAFAPVAVGLLAMAVGAKFEQAGEVLDGVTTIVLSLCSIAIVILASIEFMDKKSPGTDDKLAFASLILVTAPGMINWLKYSPAIGLIVGGLDFYGSVGSAACQFTVTARNWGKPLGQAGALAPA
jgi:hypothetical protein